jgi:hypothetical protein
MARIPLRVTGPDDYVDPTGQDPLFASRSVPRASNNFTIPTANRRALRGYRCAAALCMCFCSDINALPTLRARARRTNRGAERVGIRLETSSGSRR